MGTVRVGLTFILFSAPIVFGALGRPDNGNFFQKLLTNSNGDHYKQIKKWHEFCLRDGEEADVTGLTPFCGKNHKFPTSGAAVNSFVNNFNVTLVQKDDCSGVVIKGDFASTPVDLLFGQYKHKTGEYLEVGLVNREDNGWDVVMHTVIEVSISTELIFYKKVTAKDFIAVFISPNHAAATSTLSLLGQWFE